jgi:protein-disulfide isomerase
VLSVVACGSQTLFAEEPSAPPTNLNEAQLIHRIKTEVIRELREGTWLAEQIELVIARLVDRAKTAQEAALAEQERQAQERASHVRGFDPSRDHVRGSPEAELSLIEYSDFECPFCKQFHRALLAMTAMYPGRVNWIYRHFPLAMHNPAAQKEAEAAECAYEAGGHASFWVYADEIFARTTSNGQGFPPDRLVPLANELGLDEQAFRNCLDTGRQTTRVKEDLIEGEALGISGTPMTVLLHNRTGAVRLISGAVSIVELERVVGQLREQVERTQGQRRQGD